MIASDNATPVAWVRTTPTRMRRTACLDVTDRWDVLVSDKAEVFAALTAGRLRPADAAPFLATIARLMSECLTAQRTCRTARRKVA